MPEFRLVTKRRNKKAIAALMDGMGGWKTGNRELLNMVNAAWIPVLRDGVVPRLAPSRRIFAQPELVAVRAMEGSFLATARRKSAGAPTDPLSSAVAAMHYSAIERVTVDRLSNLLGSWMFAVGFWAYHSIDPSRAIDQALAILDDPRSDSVIAELIAEDRYKPRS